MQTELILRLISANKIVGYELHIGGYTYHGKKPVPINDGFWYCVEHELRNPGILQHGYIDHDSFELGIKVGGGWQFAGDKFESDYGNLVLIYKEEWSCWGFRNESAGFLYGGNLEKSVFKCIGTVHDEKK